MMKKILLLILPAMFVCGCQHEKSNLALGVSDGKLAPCPDSPNCVSSQSQDEKHKIAPLAYESTVAETQAELRRIIQSMQRTKIVKETEGYLHVEFKTAVMNYTDDVEFLFDDSLKIIHLRSASREGYWDLGVNRRRIEQIRQKWQARESHIRGV